MTDKPTSDDTDTDTDTDAETDADSAPPDGGTAKRPSPSAQAASRARRIGGRPAPGPRPAPTPTPSKAGAPKTRASAKRAKSAKDADTPTASASSARRGGLRAARAAATERAAEAERPATSLRKRPTGKAATVGARDAKAAAASRRRRREWLRWLPAGVLAVAALVLAVLCVALGSGVWYATKSSDEVRGEVLAAAKTCTGKVSSYDYRKLAEAKKDGLSCATGQFKKDYAKAMDTIIAKEAPVTKTTQSVQVAKAGIEQVSSDGKQWTVLIYGQHTVTNTKTGLKTPRLDKLSVRATMDKVGNKWLISKIDLIPG
ncbi:MAG: hypothetical protein DLM58_06295 [Pseudonocardiales bacterium]|nr:MAG: hypothetical protein DLM58_06295 [Pseudonocardiales bacterium]